MRTLLVSLVVLLVASLAFAQPYDPDISKWYATISIQGPCRSAAEGQSLKAVVQDILDASPSAKKVERLELNWDVNTVKGRRGDADQFSFHGYIIVGTKTDVAVLQGIQRDLLALAKDERVRSPAITLVLSFRDPGAHDPPAPR